MGLDHTLQAEIGRFVKQAGLDPRVAALKPGEEVVLDTAEISLYIHIPTPNGTLGVNITSVTLKRP